MEKWDFVLRTIKHESENVIINVIKRMSKELSLFDCLENKIRDCFGREHIFIDMTKGKLLELVLVSIVLSDIADQHDSVLKIANIDKIKNICTRLDINYVLTSKIVSLTNCFVNTINEAVQKGNDLDISAKEG